jgi:hypothetical protein
MQIDQNDSKKLCIKYYVYEMSHFCDLTRSNFTKETENLLISEEYDLLSYVV